MDDLILVRYTGAATDEFCVVGKMTGDLYRVAGEGSMVDVDLKDWPAFPKAFFEAVTLVQPEAIKETAPPPKETVVIDPTDGIDDREAVEAAGVLTQYRAEKLGRKLDRIMAVESRDPDDYYEAARDDDEAD